MNGSKKENISIEQLAKNLSSFAIDRTDLKELLASIPPENQLDLTAMEYELGILKILSVGWAISFYMAASDKKKPMLTQSYWEMIRDVSDNISTLTETTTGARVDYFAILKERLDTYVGQMKDNPGNATEPTAVMGPAFARACKAGDNAIAILIGTKMFTLTLGAVKEYLNSVIIDDITLH